MKIEKNTEQYSAVKKLTRYEPINITSKIKKKADMNDGT